MAHPRVLTALASGALALLASAGLSAQASERVLYVNLFDEKTRTPLAGLGPEAFAVREDGVAREVLRAAPASSAMPVAVVIDNTAGASRTIADLRAGLQAFVRAIEGIGPIALVSVADRPTILQDYTTDPARVQDAVSRIFAVPNSGAMLLDTIVEVCRGLEKREADRAAIVVVTTESTEFSTLHYRQVMRELEESGAMMSAIVLTHTAGSVYDDAARQRASLLDVGPSTTGGVRFDVLTSLAYEGRLIELAALLKSQYRVVYARPRTLIPPRRVTVDASRPGANAVGAPARGQGGRQD